MAVRCRASALGVISLATLIAALLVISVSTNRATAATSASSDVRDQKQHLRCESMVERMYEYLDLDGDGTVSNKEIHSSDTLSSVGLNDNDRHDLVEGCYFLSQMTVEDVQMYLSRCAKNDMFLAHFSNIDGAEMFGRLMDPAVSERSMAGMLIPARDRVALRRWFFKSLLKADRGSILEREKKAKAHHPEITDVDSTQLTVHLPQNPGACGYKVQYCQVNDGKAARANVDVCGFAWSAVYPTAGVATVYLYGLLPRHTYKIRVRSFYCDAGGINSQIVEAKTRSANKKLASSKTSRAGESAEWWARLRHQIKSNPPKLRRISATRDTILLAWDGGCRIDSNVLQTTMFSVLQAGADEKAFHEGEKSSSSGLSDQVCQAGSSALGDFAVSPISWDVLYKRDELAWSGGWEIAGCAEARRVDNMNDGPFTCFVKDLKEGRRYRFKVRGVFSNASFVDAPVATSTTPSPSVISQYTVEVESEIKRHMTGCVDDADCYGEKVCTSSYKCVKPDFSWTNLVYIVSSLLVLAMILYSYFVPGALGSKDYFLTLTKNRLDSSDQITDSYWYTQFRGRKTNKEGDLLHMDSLDQHTQHRWKNNKTVCDNFPFQMYQHQFLMSIRNEMFSVEKWLGGGSFGRVFLARPVSNRRSGTLAAWVKQRFGKKSLKWVPTGGRCFAIKFLDKAIGAQDVEMIAKSFPYHENVSRPRFWLPGGWNTGRDLHIAPRNPFFVVPYLPLGDLSQYIPKNKIDRKPLPPRFVRRIAHQALKGLQHMHQHGFIHLDIKPGNLMLSSEGILKIVDFGEIETFTSPATSRRDGNDDLDPKYNDFVHHETYDSGLRGTTMFHAPELSLPFTCGTTMKRGKEVQELYTKHDRGGMRFAYSKRFKYVRNAETQEMEKRLEDTTCGFNSKVDVYALGVSLLSMACGFQLLVKEKVTPQEEKRGEVAHRGERLSCCELLGSLVYDDDTGEILVDKVNFERLGRYVPSEYRHWIRNEDGSRKVGDGDFVKFIGNMVCNVGKRKSAFELLTKKSKQNQNSWLRSEAAEVSAGAQHSIKGSASGLVSYPKEESSDEEFCQTLLDHATDPEFIEDALKYFPTYVFNETEQKYLALKGSHEPNVSAYSGTMAGNSCGTQGYRPEQVHKIYTILFDKLKKKKAEENKRVTELKDIVASDVDKFLMKAWPDPSPDASEKEKKTAAKQNATELRKVVSEYCESKNIIHAAQLDILEIAQLCLAFYSGKRNRRFREMYASTMLTKYLQTLQSQFELVCAQQIHSHAHSISAEWSLPLKVQAKWVESPKCGWVWMRKICNRSNSKRLATMESVYSLRKIPDEKILSSVVNNGHCERSDSVESIPSSIVRSEHITPDSFKWSKFFMILKDDCLSCYSNIVESILEEHQVEFMELNPGIDANCIDATDEIPLPFDQPKGFRISDGVFTWFICVDPTTSDKPDNEYKTTKDGCHHTWLDAVAQVLQASDKQAAKAQESVNKSTLERLTFDNNGFLVGLDEERHHFDQHGPSGHRALRSDKKGPSFQFWTFVEVSLPEELKQEANLRAWAAAAGMTRHLSPQTYCVPVPVAFDEARKTFGLEQRLGSWSQFLHLSEVNQSFPLSRVCVKSSDPDVLLSEGIEHPACTHSNTVEATGTMQKMSQGVSAFTKGAIDSKPGSKAMLDKSSVETAVEGIHPYDIELESLRAEVRRMTKSLGVLEMYMKERIGALERSVRDNDRKFRLASSQSTATEMEFPLSDRDDHLPGKGRAISPKNEKLVLFS